MTEDQQPSIRSRQVAAELRRLRKSAGLTTGEVGTRLGISQSKVSRIENSKLGLSIEEVAALLGLYQVPTQRREQLLDLVRRAAEPGWVQVHGGNLPDQWQTLIDWEGRSIGLRDFAPLVVPGLLQTADYARAIISATAKPEVTETGLDTMVAARLGRQSILSRALPPDLHVILGEHALRMPVGGDAVMHAQLRHLAEMAQRRQVTIQVVPLAAGPHPGLEGSFVLMDFEHDPSMVYVENKVQSIFIEAPTVTPYALAWERMLELALTPKRSTDFLAHLVAGYEHNGAGRGE